MLITPFEFRTDLWHRKTRVPALSYDLFGHVGTTLACDGQTDTRHRITAYTVLV